VCVRRIVLSRDVELVAVTCMFIVVWRPGVGVNVYIVFYYVFVIDNDLN